MTTTAASLEKIKPANESPDPVDLHVGSRLRLRRNLMGMSQDQLGKASGLTFQQIQKYEHGTNRIAASRLFQLAGLLNVEVSWFFEGLGSGVSSPAENFSSDKQNDLSDNPGKGDQILYQRETLELIRGYYRITDPKQRRKVFELIKSMAEEAQ